MPGPTRFTIEDNSGASMPSQATPEMNAKASGSEKAFFLPKKAFTACFTLDQYIKLATGADDDNKDE